MRSIHKTASKNPLQAVSNGAMTLIHLRLGHCTAAQCGQPSWQQLDEPLVYCFAAHETVSLRRLPNAYVARRSHRLEQVLVRQYPRVA